MTTKEDFIKRYNDVKESVIEGLDKALKRAVVNGCLDYDKMEDNYADVYPLIAAVLQKEVHDCLEGGSYEWRMKQQKKQCRAYRNDLRIWRDYAGDGFGHGE